MLQRAVKFTSAMPFVNPSRAPPSVVQLQGGRFMNSDIPTQNAVFLTTGIISECALVTATESSPPSYGVPGAAVRRVKLRPFAVEFERAAAFFGHFLDTKGSDEYLGPIYNNGLAFVTRKEGTNKCRLSLTVSIVCANFWVPAASAVVPSTSHLLASSPTTGRSGGGATRVSKSASKGRPATAYPQSLSFDDEG